MRNYEQEYKDRVAYIREYVEKTGVKGIVYGNSGGKDCTLVGILCKAACENTVGVIMPCGSSRNYGSDRDDALAVAEKYGIETRTVDLTAVRDAEVAALKGVAELNTAALRERLRAQGVMLDEEFIAANHTNPAPVRNVGCI